MTGARRRSRHVPTNAREAGIARLQKAIRAHVRAQIDLSWKGSQHPDDWDGIEMNATAAAVDLGYAIHSLTIIENNERWDSQFQRLRTARERKVYIKALDSKDQPRPIPATT